jgi:competence protein ComEC
MKVPLFRFLVFFIAGILLAIYFPKIKLSDGILFSSILLTIFLIYFLLRRSIFQTITVALLAYCFTFLTGYNITLLKAPDRYAHFQYAPARELRGKILNIYSKYGIRGNEYGVLSAMTLGDREELDKQIVKDYAAIGVIHIIVVAGLHLGIVFLGLNFFLGFLNRTAKSLLLKDFLLITLIWAYALITGLAPSICRAATMLSFFIVGKMFSKSTNTYNLLAASAFLLLCINPYMLLNIGFQLSYAAVFGIVYLHPKIYHLYDSDYWLIRKAWLITSISIAAQVFTLPLSLLYFHQFPNYFLLANLFVIPLTTGIIWMAIGLLITSYFPYVAFPIAWLLNKMIHSLNWIVDTIHQLPNALIRNIYITMLEAALLYAIIFTTVELFRRLRRLD